MELKNVKAYMNKTVYYDIGQVNFSGCSIKDFVLTACILRKKKNAPFYYQAELMSTENNKSVIIVPLEEVLTKNDV